MGDKAVNDFDLPWLAFLPEWARACLSERDEALLELF